MIIISIKKEVLIKFLEEGKTYKEIANKLNCSSTTVGYWITKYNINKKSINSKPVYKDLYYFNVIDTKEKAYIVGFLLGDCSMHTNKEIHLSIAKKDKEILEFIQKEIGGNITFTETKKGYPMGNMCLGQQTLYEGLIDKFSNKRLKSERYLRGIPVGLEKYVVLGFLDADGTIYGNFDKTGRFRFKIGFYSPKSILQSIQRILFNNGFLMTINPDSQKKMSRMVTGGKDLTFGLLNWLYDDLIVLKRKYKKSQEINKGILKHLYRRG